MKKIVLTIGLFVSVTTNAQTITFDDLTLAPETGWNGSDGSGSFTSNGQVFINGYNTGFGYWADGWGYSNKTDVNTAGYTNDLSCYAASGYMSDNFAIGRQSSFIDFGSEKVVTSIQLTNMTYAALSMLNGDMFAKQFGTPNDANGQPDGTNGEDFFRINLIGRDADSIVTDTIVFYLADYRGADSLDYMLTSWQGVDLSTLGEIQYLAFELESSDVGDFGINTPLYFAMDQLVLSGAEIAENEINFSVFPNPATNFISLKQAGHVSIYALDGSVVLTKTVQENEQISIESLNSGSYLIELNSSGKIGRARLMKL
jgi:hypothetical protein